MISIHRTHADELHCQQMKLYLKDRSKIKITLKRLSTQMQLKVYFFFSPKAKLERMTVFFSSQYYRRFFPTAK